MRTPLQAQLWEVVRTSWAETLARIVGMFVFVALLCSLGWHFDFSQPQLLFVRSLVVMMSIWVAVFSGTWLCSLDNRSGFSFRLGFIRPISTAQLVVVPLVYTIVTAVICYVVPTKFFGAMMGTDVPLLGPAMVIVGALSCLCTSVWSPTTILGKVIALVTTAAVIVLLFVSLNERSGNQVGTNGDLVFLMALGTPEFWHFRWQHYLISITIFLVASTATVASVKRQRCGDSLPLSIPIASHLKRRPERVHMTSPKKGTKGFGSRWSAQLWYELQRIAPPVMILAMIVPLFVIGLVNLKHDWEYANRFLLTALIACPVLYQLVGAGAAVGLRQKNGNTSLPVFDSTRAMTSEQLILIKLASIAGCAFVAWIIMAAAAGLQLYVSADPSLRDAFFAAITHLVTAVEIHWWIAGVASLVLCFVFVTSILLAFSYWLPLHPKMFYGCGLFGLLNVGILAFDLASDWSFQVLWDAYSYLAPIVSVAICVYLLKRALTTGFLSKMVFLAVCVLWAIHVYTTVSLAVRFAPELPFEIPTIAYVSAAASLIVPLAATAAAPLALASHRHR